MPGGGQVPRRLGGGRPGRWGGPGRRGLAVLAGGPGGCVSVPGLRAHLPQAGVAASPPSPSPLPRPELLPWRPFPASLPGPRTCKELLTRGHLLSGWHTIYLPDCRPLTVLCDMDVDGGGWTVSGGDPAMAVGFLGRGGPAREPHLVAHHPLVAFVRPSTPSRLRLTASFH